VPLPKKGDRDMSSDVVNVNLSDADSASLDRMGDALCAIEDHLVLKKGRRERIATAMLAGILANPDYHERREKGFAREAIEFADELIAELDKKKVLA
jgi:hypothetical protein